MAETAKTGSGRSPSGDGSRSEIARTSDRMTRTCIDCGKGIGRDNKSGRCNSCYHGMDRRALIISMYREGSTYAEISAVNGMAKQAIYGVLKRSGEIHASNRDHSGEYHRRATTTASQRLSMAIERHISGMPPIGQGGRPSSVADRIATLDALSRTRALTLDESLELEKAIHTERRATRTPMPSKSYDYTLAGGSPL